MQKPLKAQVRSQDRTCSVSQSCTLCWFTRG